ncbi:MAG: hypothetical protein QXR30_05010 [Candidatus Woesearchaeota archaeon]
MYQLNLISFISLLKEKRKFLIINFLIIGIFSTIVAFILPKWYYSFSTIRPAENKGISIFSAVLGAKGLSGISKNLSVGSLQYSDLDYYKSLLLSRNIALRMIEKFDLKNVYQEEYIFKTIEKLHDNTTVNVDNKSNLLIIGVYDKDPQKAKLMVEEYLRLLDSLVSSIDKEITLIEANNLESRYLRNLQDLKTYEDSLKEFQKKFGVIIPDEQFIATTKVYAELQAKKLLLDLELQKLKENFGNDVPELKSLQVQINTINEKIREIERSSVTDKNFKVFIPFNNAPDLLVQYARLYRNLEIQQKLLEYIYPIYEQMKLELDKKSQAFVVIDNPFVPEYKAKPKRAIIIISAVFLYMLFVVLFVVVIDYIKKLKLNKYESVSK